MCHSCLLLCCHHKKGTLFGTCYYWRSCFSSSLIHLFNVGYIIMYDAISSMGGWLVLKDSYCAFLMRTTNINTAQSMQEKVNDNLFSGHVKFTIGNFFFNVGQYLFQPYLDLFRSKSLHSYNVVAFNDGCTPAFHMPPLAGSRARGLWAEWDEQACLRKILPSLILHDLRPMKE